MLLTPGVKSQGAPTNSGFADRGIQLSAVSINGGPLWFPKLYNGKDRSFFFFNYEEWQYSRYRSNFLSVPTEAMRRGDFSPLADANGRPIPIYDPATTRANPAGAGFLRDPFVGNVIPAARFDSVPVNMLPFYPTPNRAPTNPYTQSNNWLGQVSEKRDMQQWTAKGDHRFGNRNSLQVRYSYYKHFNDNGYFSAYPDPNMRNRLDNYENRNGIITDTHTFSPAMLNEFRLSIARQYFPFQAYSWERNWISKLGLPPSIPDYTLPRVSIGGLPDPGAFSVGLRRPDRQRKNGAARRRLDLLSNHLLPRLLRLHRGLRQHQYGVHASRRQHEPAVFSVQERFALPVHPALRGQARAERFPRAERELGPALRQQDSHVPAMESVVAKAVPWPVGGGGGLLGQQSQPSGGGRLQL